MAKKIIFLMCIALILCSCVSHRDMVAVAATQSVTGESPIPNAVGAAHAADPETAAPGYVDTGDAPGDMSLNEHQNVLPSPGKELMDEDLKAWIDNALHGTRTQEAPPADVTGPIGNPGDVDPDKPMVALTFDDGPGKATQHILDLLTEYGGKATFFMVGSVAVNKMETVQRVYLQGSEIGNHTWAHAKLTDLSYEEIYRQIEDTNAMIEGITGYRPVVMRPVGGSNNDAVKSVAQQLGVAVINWSVDTKDWKHRDAEKTYEAVMKDVRDGSIIICHDLYESTGVAMERVIPELIAQGYQLVTVSELLNCRPEGMQAGVLYTKK